MLGFGPISSTPISGEPFSLVVVSTALAATISFSFAIDARAGLFNPMSANVGFAFGVSGTLSVLQSLSATTTLTFGGHANLRLAGKPLKFFAVPVSFSFRAMPDSYTFKAVPEQFTFRGVR